MTVYLLMFWRCSFFKALEREDKDKVFVGNLFTSAVSGVLRTKEDGQRLRSTLRIRICVCFLHQCLVAFPQCLKPIRKDVWDVLHEPFFFKVDRLTLLQWKSVFTLTVQSDIQWHYQDLMTRFAASQVGSRLGSAVNGTVGSSTAGRGKGLN